ncbi:uncharacterized protein AB675_1060 [Cyphellophora attinorum]|uniref:Protein kinase domain-containing protein n=1 Tax=Cyphellophora attinorum TaxID=1664694 RepID=A0A0N1NXG1_9EURO|nr:uncharacterized protein AB675_1060 [Phialophora attinorum]KPI38136.1 hypothetical protein AB675_1060 [Phialophora attinorum]
MSRPPSSHSRFDTNPDIQEFREWIDRDSCIGVSFKRDKFQAQKFLPPDRIRDWFDWHDPAKATIILGLVRAALGSSATRSDALDIAKRCPEVFCTLIYIGKAKYIKLFLQNRKLWRLPLEANSRASFPRLANGEDFFDEFYQEQWRFCAEPLSGGLTTSIMEDDRILPLEIVTELSKHGGSSAVVHLCKVLPELDNLDRDGRDPSVSEDGQTHQYVVKSYHDSDQARKYFEAEVDAFQKLNNTGEKIPNLIGCYGAFKQNGSYHVILEYANVGTLEDYFNKVNPPEEKGDVLKLWTNLFDVNNALVKIHDGGDSNSSASQKGEIFQGWHQDIKPSNILVKGDVGVDPYGVQFMLADLGLSHFANTITDTDTHGARSYRAPECNTGAAHAFSLRVKQVIDTWSLACVYSETIAWVVGGQHELGRYRESRRRASSDSKFPGFHFHDNKGNVSDVVADLHQERWLKRRRLEDTVTACIWQELLQHVFVKSEARLNAQQMVTFSENVIRRATIGPLQRAETAPTSGPDDSDRPRTPPNSPPGYMASHSRQTSHRHPPLETAHSSPPGSSALYESSEARRWTKSSSGKEDHSPSPTTGSTEPHQHHGSPSQSQNRQPLHSNISRARTFDEHRPDIWDDPGSPVPIAMRSRVATDSASHAQHRADVNRALALERLEAAPTQSTRQRPSTREYSSTTEPQKIASKLPDFSPDELRDWVKEVKAANEGLWNKMKSRVSTMQIKALPNEKRFLEQLSERDHIFVLDDGNSMREHRKAMTQLSTNLMFFIKHKKLDLDGSTVCFIASSKQIEHQHITELTKFVQRNLHFEGKPNFAHRLEKILEWYRTKLRGQPNAKPISLYVFTDGTWRGTDDADPTSPEEDIELQDVANVIDNTVEFLESRRARLKQVGIQFIRYGDDEVGRARLEWLDDELKGAKNMKRDICDTTGANGNVWKMLVGSIDSTVDPLKDVTNGVVR